MKNCFLKKISAWTWAFLILLVTFFSAGIATLGSFKTTGESAVLSADESTYYTVNLPSGEKLGGVYVNVGAIYAPVGESVGVTVKTATSSSSSASFSTLGSTVQLSNVYSKEGKNGANHNWICIISGQEKSGVKQLSFTADRPLELCEIVALTTEGKQIELTETSAKNNGEEMLERAAATLDAQDSFVLKNDLYYNFTQEEGYMLASLDTLFSGKSVYESASYTLLGNFNYLAILFTVPLYVVFGGSVFALRITSFLATCALLVFSWLLFKEIVKSEKAAFAFATLLAFGGMATTVGRLGSGYALVASALVASAYFACRFFSRGIDSGREIQGGLNVFFSGLFSAIALCMTTSAVFPVAGVAVLLGFGMRRQRLAYQVAMAKLPETETEKAVARKRAYEYKNRVAWGFAALSFVAGTFVLLVTAGAICYTAALKTYGGETGFATALWKGIASSFLGGDTTAFTAENAGNAFAWWLPIKSALLYEGANVYGSGETLRFAVGTTTALTFVCPVAFLGATAKVVYDFVKKDSDKQTLRVRRGYFLLLGGAVTATLSGLFIANVSAVYAMFFSVCYVGFIPLLAAAFERKNALCKTLVNVLLITLAVGVLVTFALSLPTAYGIVTAA